MKPYRSCWVLGPGAPLSSTILGALIEHTFWVDHTGPVTDTKA